MRSTQLLGYNSVIREISSLFSEEYGLDYNSFRELFWLLLGINPIPKSEIRPSGRWCHPHPFQANEDVETPHEDIYFDLYFDISEIPSTSLKDLVKKINDVFPKLEAQALLNWHEGREPLVKEYNSLVEGHLQLSSRNYLECIRLETSKVFIYAVPKILDYLSDNPAYLDGRFNFETVKKLLSREVNKYSNHMIGLWESSNLFFDALCLLANVHSYKKQDYLNPDSALQLSLKGKAELREHQQADCSELVIRCDVYQIKNLQRLFNYYAEQDQAEYSLMGAGSELTGYLKLPNKVFMRGTFLKKLRATIAHCINKYKTRYLLQHAFYCLEHEQGINLLRPRTGAFDEEKAVPSSLSPALAKIQVLKERAFDKEEISGDELTATLKSIEESLSLPPSTTAPAKVKSWFCLFSRPVTPTPVVVPITPLHIKLNDFIAKVRGAQEFLDKTASVSK